MASKQPRICAPPATEHQEQCALVEWARLMGSRAISELALLVAIPNGGHRHPAVAAKLRQEGVRAGFPDMFLPVPRSVYHGLFVEIKRTKGGRLSCDQAAWHAALRDQGYRVECCAGFEAARAAIVSYLGAVWDV